jgi:hypothetical protein|tara:strand:+ start:1907 stop:2347 length:441 start_codon:yes stop_codon:yes gene_type:complete
MIGGAIINTMIGAGIKLAANLLNAWLEHRSQTQLLLAAKDRSLIDALTKNQQAQATKPFVQVTRRVLFLSITFTLCYLMIFYAMNPGISYDILVPTKDDTSSGLLGWLIGSKDYTVVRLTGGLLLTSFMDLAFMVIGFYAIPSRRR